jgi:ATP-dependent DNA helicase RecG
MARRPKLDPRAMMQKAIEVMLQSVSENRADKPSPLVGAVLVHPDGKVVTACRGELRDGDHAEFTLLERKSRDVKLDDCVLFATLEPCLNRNAPKRGCARHIVSARIKEVYVGVEDDNPDVAGKGIEHLRRHGVTVHMFERDLQEQILAANKSFFEWARQQVEEPEEAPIKLSKYEDPVPAIEWGDLSQEALELYQSKVHVGAAFDSDGFRQLLRRQGILIDAGQKMEPSGFGLLLFGKHPADSMPQARLLARAELANGKTTRQDFDQPLVLVPDALETWLQKILPSTVSRDRMEREERVDLPFEMIREAVVNALIHRDYDLSGEKCHLLIDADTIKIKSPGGPIPPITLEQMQSFSAPMKSRNPLLHYVFARLGLAEEQGFGLTSLRDEAERLGLPLPTYSMEGDALVLTIFRSRSSASTMLKSNVLSQLTKTELEAWQWLSTRESTTTSEFGDALKLPSRSALRLLGRFTDLGLLEKTGSRKATRFTVRR